MAKSASKKPVAGKTRRQVLEELDMSHSESEDERLGKELDRGRKGAGEETDEDDMEEEEVMGFDGSEEDEDEEESGDEGEEDEDEMDDSDAEHDARLAKLAKKMEQRVKLQQGGSDEEGDDEDEEDEGTAGWSKRKQDYYGADVADPEAESDEEVMREEQEEQEEVERLEARRAAGLTNRDFELSGSGSSDDESEEEEAGGARGGKAGGRQVEVVEKELDQMTAEERRAAVQRDAPELEALLEELRGALREVRHRVGPLLQEVRGGEVATQQGVSYLEAKHLLLLQYCAAIVFYLLLKAEGRPVRDHPVVLRLVALRGYLEKIRPIDRKLQHQMQKLLQAARVAQEQEGGEDAEEAGAKEQDFGPRPDLLVPKVPGAAADAAEADGNGTANGVYRPPKINPVSMEDDPDKPALSRDDRRRLVQARRRAARSQLVRELVEELEGAPEEQRATVAGMESVAAIRQRQRLEARAEEEEDMFTRVPLSKEELKKLKANRRAGLSGAALLDDFADEVNDLVEMAGAPGQGGRGLADLFQRHKVSQKYGADLTDDTRAARNKSGDADLPDRAPLHERRAKYDSVAARRAAAAHDADGFPSDDDNGGFGDYDNAGPKRGAKRGREGGEEDEFYVAAREASQAKRAAKREAYEGAAMVGVPAPDATTAAPRKISREIEKNRGLTPHRRKDIKNPRKKNRIKYGQAVVRRKGQVQDVRAGSAGYGGEATGIKARVSKSRKF